MANDSVTGEQPGKIEALLDRWQISLDLHAGYVALDDARYWHVQPWPKHERPQRWIIQLARKRILALKRIVSQRLAEGDRAFIEGIETMGFLATLVGITSVERYIPLATRETERGEVLDVKPDEIATRPATRSRTSARHGNTPRSRRRLHAPASTGVPPRPRARCRRCPIQRPKERWPQPGPVRRREWPNHPRPGANRGAKPLGPWQPSQKRLIRRSRRPNTWSSPMRCAC